MVYTLHIQRELKKNLIITSLWANWQSLNYWISVQFKRSWLKEILRISARVNFTVGLFLCLIFLIIIVTFSFITHLANEYAFYIKLIFFVLVMNLIPTMEWHIFNNKSNILKCGKRRVLNTWSNSLSSLQYAVSYEVLGY